MTLSPSKWMPIGARLAIPEISLYWQATCILPNRGCAEILEPIQNGDTRSFQHLCQCGLRAKVSDACKGVESGPYLSSARAEHVGNILWPIFSDAERTTREEAG